MNNEHKRCPQCTLAGRYGGWLQKDTKRFNCLVCPQCGHKELGRMNSTVEPAKEKRGFIMDAWSRVSRL
jgi:hypothetical protein